MKKFFLFVTIIVLAVTIAQAQFDFGVKGGLTIARINLDLQDNISADANYGAHGAVFFNIGKGLLSFQPELMFIQKGVHVNDMQSNDFAEYTLNYVDVPMLARATIGLGLVNIYFNFGGYGGYLLSSKQKVSIAVQTNGHSYEVTELNEWDAGFILGAGVKVLSLIFELRYGQGLINVSNNTETYQDSKNTYLNISLGVQF